MPLLTLEPNFVASSEMLAAAARAPTTPDRPLAASAIATRTLPTLLYAMPKL
jgi:hypothetical protein